jgi:hypothetical protein
MGSGNSFKAQWVFCIITHILHLSSHQCTILWDRIAHRDAGHAKWDAVCKDRTSASQECAMAIRKKDKVIMDMFMAKQKYR